MRLSLRGMAIALAAWFGGVALATLVGDPQAVVVFGPDADRVVANAGAWPLSASTNFVSARLGEASSVRALYANGAWFVWPVFRAGCGA